MAYYLKKTKLKGRTYLSIDESFYNPEKKGTSHRCYKSLGSVETWLSKGLKDPVTHFQKEVDSLNRERSQKGTRKISDHSPLLCLGYFPLKAVLEKLNVKNYVDYFKLTTDFQFDLYELLSSLIFARAVNPCSKHKTFHEVLPNLYHPVHYSYDQLMHGLAFIGNDYQKFVEIFTVQTGRMFGLDTSRSYFDCTNFYFEIDREDDFRRKGPSKEGKKDPIVGLGLLLDSDQIPVGMKMYPGNESEKPILRDVIGQLKAQNNISGKTIHVADKGLNCAKNIAFSKKNGDGYLFSKSVKGLPETEKTWVLLDEGWEAVKDKKGKVLYWYKSCIDEFPYKVEHDGAQSVVKLREKRLLTYNPSLAAKKRYEINRLVEKARALTVSGAKRNEYGEAVKDKKGKVLYWYKSCIDEFPYKVEHDGAQSVVKLREKRLLTYNPSLAAKKRYEINRLVEKARALTVSGAKRNEYGEAGKYVDFTDKAGGKAIVAVNRDAIEKDLKFAGYNLLVTSETNMKDRDIYETYHNLWRIEESFKIMKSDLDARPAFCQKEETIKGHFLVCYLTVLLERILQLKVLGNQYGTSEVFSFMKDFKVTKAETKYINTAKSSEIINGLSEKFNLPLTNYFLTETQIKSILNHKL